MAFTYHIEENEQMVHIVGTDQGSLGSASDTFANIIADPHLHRPFGMLIDVRTLHNVPSREEADSISKFASIVENEKHFTALLVKKGIQYGIARMIQLYSELRGAQIEVFIDDQSAQYWLWEQLAFVARANSSDANK
jgi:hypothetical protein